MEIKQASLDNVPKDVVRVLFDHLVIGGSSCTDEYVSEKVQRIEKKCRWPIICSCCNDELWDGSHICLFPASYRSYWLIQLRATCKTMRNLVDIYRSEKYPECMRIENMLYSLITKPTKEMEWYRILNIVALRFINLIELHEDHDFEYAIAQDEIFVIVPDAKFYPNEISLKMLLGDISQGEESYERKYFELTVHIQWLYIETCGGYLKFRYASYRNIFNHRDEIVFKGRKIDERPDCNMGYVLIRFMKQCDRINKRIFCPW